MPEKTKNLLPSMLVIAVILIGGFAYAKYGTFPDPKAISQDNSAKGSPWQDRQGEPLANENICEQPIDESVSVNVPNYTKDDHVCGNPSAKIVIVEYSDLECPYCKVFHKSMHELMKNYGTQVAWIYRHFPLDSLHSRARKEAEASECAYELAGRIGFWKFIDKVFEVTSSNNTLSPELLPLIAQEVGLDKTAFETCFVGGSHALKVQADQDLGTKANTEGTPNSIIYVNGVQKDTIPGALPYDQVKSKIDLLLKI